MTPTDTIIVTAGETGEDEWFEQASEYDVRQGEVIVPPGTSVIIAKIA